MIFDDSFVQQDLNDVCPICNEQLYEDDIVGYGTYPDDLGIHSGSLAMGFYCSDCGTNSIRKCSKNEIDF